jgi:phosphatidylglycerol:prolipoprotein diacylglycerol transferase
MSLPYLAPPDLDLGLPIHVFGVIACIGISVGAAVMRRYTRRVGESDDDARAMIARVAIAGMFGAHVFDVLFYRPGEALAHPWVLLAFWTSISSYGGFIGGAIAFVWVVRRRRLRVRRWADITMVGLLVAFTIGRAGCTTVHDHLGAETSSAIGVDVPRSVLVQHGLAGELSSHDEVVRVHDLGMEELLYLLPVNALVLWLAFRRRLPAGVLAALAAALYAPVRFGLERWRLTASDPPYLGLTFAQWCSIAVFAVAVIAGTRALRARDG